MGFSSCRSTPDSVAAPLLLVAIVCASSIPSHAADTLFKGQSIATNESLISPTGVFQLGFFTPGSSTGSYYLGIWYNNFSVKTVVWVANRVRPLEDSNGSLSLRSDGTLAVLSAAGAVVWSSNSSIDWTNSSAKLGDDGNFELLAGNSSQAVLWQSFDHPTDTFVPGMKITMDLATRDIQRFVSWRAPEDPSPGNYSLGLDPMGSAQIYIWNGKAIRWRSGQWNKVSFIGITRMTALSIYGFSLLPNDAGKMVLSFNAPNASLLRFVMQWDGIENTSIWDQEKRAWNGVWLQPLTACETYNFCGNHSICSGEDQCSCLRGFEPRSGEAWRAGNWSGGCVRRTPLGCQSNGSNSSAASGGGGGGDSFARFDNVKLPDFAMNLPGSPSDEAGCAALCSGNCSFVAYSYVEQIGCMTWGGDLVDVAQFTTGGSTLYLKLAGSEFVSDDNSKLWILWVVLSVFLAVILCLALYLWWKYKAKIKGWWKTGNDRRDSSIDGSGFSREAQQGFSGARQPEDQPNEGKDSDLPVFTFDAIVAATDNFSDSNKLGQGGFGHVYRGVLLGGHEIAVKRLSRSSGQGADEFKNELTLIAKLQHRNLVKLLGCCVQGNEKILIYEYMPNKSLDCFLFDPTRQPQLDWSKRFNIIEGIARGLLYLHRDSRLRIIHRDLKASNILLDEEMNPKISDFGMARIFGGNQNHDNTNRVVGTFGYMSPEYAMEGLFSVKSDVYSFGVLMLEIVSGRKNSRTRSDNYTNLLGYAWQLWTAERAEEIIDPCIRDSCPTHQVLRCIHIGLLSVQDRAHDRPTMSSVVIMLGSEAPIHQMPKQPTFAAEGSPSETGSSQKHDGDGYSVNDVTITTLSGR